MTNILIIEDEPLAAKRLTRLIGQLGHPTQILDTLDSVTEAVSWLSQHEADLIFLDIHLADGDSFAIFDQVEVKTPIIFATAYDQYAIRAFKLNSVDYLLKPIETAELEHAFEKFLAQRSDRMPLDVQALVAAMQAPAPGFQKRFMVTSGEKIKSVPIEEVAYFYGQQKYVFLITKDNRRHIVDYTLGKLEGLLDPEQFFRINRQFIIGFDAISNMFSYSKSRVKVELEPASEVEAIVSIEKARHFKDWLNR
ncbi:MAG: LytTR family DNA-binding domain-containing protein [Bacteroidota bacterium]